MNKNEAAAENSLVVALIVTDVAHLVLFQDDLLSQLARSSNLWLKKIVCTVDFASFDQTLISKVAKSI